MMRAAYVIVLLAAWRDVHQVASHCVSMYMYRMTGYWHCGRCVLPHQQVGPWCPASAMYSTRQLVLDDMSLTKHCPRVLSF